MVAIKNKMNASEDLAAIEAKRTAATEADDTLALENLDYLEIQLNS
jgi:hypothetical protein